MGKVLSMSVPSVMKLTPAGNLSRSESIRQKLADAHGGNTVACQKIREYTEFSKKRKSQRQNGRWLLYSRWEGDLARMITTASFLVVDVIVRLT